MPSGTERVAVSFVANSDHIATSDCTRASQVVFRHACKRGYEGIVSKRLGSIPLRTNARLGQGKEPERARRPSGGIGGLELMADVIRLCPTCRGLRWVCENHRDHPWDGLCCGGAGAPCPACNVPDAGDAAQSRSRFPDRCRQVPNLSRRRPPQGLCRRLELFDLDRSHALLGLCGISHKPGFSQKIDFFDTIDPMRNALIAATVSAYWGTAAMPTACGKQ
jgi:hypothetical protein